MSPLNDAPNDADRTRRLRDFLEHVQRLKNLPRRGWIDRGIPIESAESVAEHSFQTAIIAWIAAAGDPTLDRDRILKLALVHDLPESIIGDVTPYEPGDVPDRRTDPAGWRSFLDRRQQRSDARTAQKRAAEAEAVSALLDHLHGVAQEELTDLFEELIEGRSPESQFVKQADKLETWLQSRAYSARDPDLPMISFQIEIEELALHPALAAIRDVEQSA